MRAAILSIGTELTRGELSNTNASWLGSRLTDLGFEVTRIDCVDDNIPRIATSLKQLASEHALIVSTGGLGPTTDDLTSEAAAIAAGVPLVRDEAEVAVIIDKFRHFLRTMPESNKKQADFPQGAIMLPNQWGTASGFRVMLGTCRAYFMPGVPREMMPIFEAHVVPDIAGLAPHDTVQLRLVTYSKTESEVGELMAGIEAAHPGVTIGYRAHFPEIEVKVLARGDNKADAEARATAAAIVVRARLHDIVVGEGDSVRFPELLGAALRDKKLTLALAESCTGGLLSHLLTAAPASDFFLGSMVSYANSAKVAMLGVAPALLDAHGAVSAEVALAMAEGARKRFSSDLAVSITGIAGPTGGSAEKPVGTVHIALASADGSNSRAYHLRGERARIQRHAAFQAMRLMLSFCRASRR